MAMPDGGMTDQAVLRMLRLATRQVRQTSNVTKATLSDAQQLLQMARRIGATIVLAQSEKK